MSLGKFIAEAFVRPIVEVIMEEIRRPRIFMKEEEDPDAEADLDALLDLPVVGVSGPEGRSTARHDKEPPTVRITRDPGIRS